jgi:hypothetical protein
MNTDTLLNAVHLVFGVTLFILGLSFAWKCYQAAGSGKVDYWSGLQHYGMLFAPITLFLSPLLCHLPHNPGKSLIQTRQSLWVHLFFGPLFFVLALMCMTSGADLVGLGMGNKDGGASTSLNWVLTLGRSDVPPCIIYSPPRSQAYLDIGTYRFPFVKKASKKILRFLCTTIPTKKEDSYNPYEKNGEAVDKYTKTGIPWLDDDDEDDRAAAAAAVPVTPTTTAVATPSNNRRRKK